MVFSGLDEARTNDSTSEAPALHEMQTAVQTATFIVHVAEQQTSTFVAAEGAGLQFDSSSIGHARSANVPVFAS